jgi:hypothetical protein
MSQSKQIGHSCVLAEWVDFSLFSSSLARMSLSGHSSGWHLLYNAASVGGPYTLSDIQVLLPHLHSNIWNIRPVGGSGILVVNFGCSRHLKHGGEVGSGRACCFSMGAKNLRRARSAIKLSD